MKRNYSQSFKTSLVFPEKWFCVRRANFAFLTLLSTFSRTEDSIQAFSRFQNKFIENSNMERKYLKSFNASLAFPERWFCFHQVNFGLLRLLPTFSRSEDSIYAFYRLQNKSVGKSNERRKFSGSFNVCLAFPEKWFCIRRANFAFFNLLPIFNHTEDSIQGFGRLQNKFTENSNMERKYLNSFKASLTFPEKWFCIR